MPYSEDGSYKVGKISFDPKTVMVKVKGSTSPNYLEVKYRLIMLREMFPEAVHTTEILYHDPNGGEGGLGIATVQATIKLPNGAIGQGIKTEEKKHFTDYLEKAETGATGRALYTVGIGAQYSKVDYDYESESPKDFKGVDSPVADNRTNKQTLTDNKNDLLAILAGYTGKLPGGSISQKAEELFHTKQSSQLNEKQLQKLVEWAEQQTV